MRSLLLALSLALTLASLIAPPAAAQDRPRRPAVIFGTDMDFDDAATLAYLSQEHRAGRIELRAITVTSAGAGLPGRAIRHAGRLADRLGLGGVAIAEDSRTGPNAFPAGRLIGYATSAGTAAFERRFLDVLNGR